MGIFGNFFGKNEDERAESGKEILWIDLTETNQLDAIIEKSKARPQAIFKHSTTCGISRMVLNMFKSSYSLEPSQMDFYFLDLHANRNVSNAVAERLDVMHQSPQLLIVKNGVVVAHSSHGGISEIQLENHI